jgi:hypothetical protein
LGKQVTVLLDDGRNIKSTRFRTGALADLKEGAHVRAELSKDQKSVVAIWAQGPTVAGIIKAIDAEKRAITLVVGKNKNGEAPPEQTWTLAKDAQIIVDGKDGEFADLATEAVATARLSGDQKGIGMIQTQGRSVLGRLKAVDAEKREIVVTTAKKGETTGEDVTYPLAKDAKVIVYGQEARLKDLPSEMPVVLRLLSNNRDAGVIETHGPIVQGVLKSVDAASSTLTVLVSPGDKTRPAEEKTFPVAKDVPIRVGAGKSGALADLPTDRQITLWLAPDQERVMSITVAKKGK